MTVAYQLSQLDGQGVEPVLWGGYKPIRLYLDRGTLFADVSLYGGGGQPPIELKHNEFVLRRADWDRNFDSVALEIVNESKFPVFQLIYESPYKIIINGVFPLPTGLILAGDYGLSLNAPFIRKGFTIQRLFKYPSNQYLAQRQEVTNIMPVTPGSQLKNRAISLSNKLITFSDSEMTLLDAVGQTADTINKPEEFRKALTRFISLYDDRYVLRSVHIIDELAAAGLSVGSLPSTSRMLSDPGSARNMAEQFRKLANQLP
jgi:hypothetical protein